MQCIRFTLAALGAASLLAACGSSDGPAAAPASAQNASINGLAATGAGLGNANLTAKCATGAPITGVTQADGSFTLVLSGGQTVPCLVQVTKGAVTLHSFAAQAGRLNITPLTDLVLNRALGTSASAAFTNFNAATTPTAIKASFDAAKAYVKALSFGLTGSAPSGDLFTGVFAVGDADDKVLDALAASLTASGKKLDDLREGVTPAGAAKATALRGKLIGTPTVVTTLTAAQINDATSTGLVNLSGTATCDVKVVALNYNTVGVLGENTNASAVLLAPVNCTAGGPANGALVAYAKGTDVEKPRTLANPGDGETFLLTAIYAGRGYNVVATDYLGFAQSAYKYHPYLHADSEASSVIDSIRAARNAAAAAGATLTTTGDVLLAGYSQGGHSSMAAHRAIERDNAAEIKVKAGAHLAGPYNLSGSFKIPNAIAGYQFFVPYLVTAWQKVYGTVYSDVKAVFKAPYDSYIETLLPSPTLTYTTLVTSGKLPGGPAVSPAQARDAIFQAAFLTDTRTNNNNGLFLAGKKNDLLGWSPVSALMLCGGAGDPTVPPALHQTVMKADFDSRSLTNVTSVDVDAFVQATYGTAGAAPTDPSTADFAVYYGNYHGVYEPPFCHAQAKGFFDNVLAPSPL